MARQIHRHCPKWTSLWRLRRNRTKMSMTLTSSVNKNVISWQYSRFGSSIYVHEETLRHSKLHGDTFDTKDYRCSCVKLGSQSHSLCTDVVTPICVPTAFVILGILITSAKEALSSTLLVCQSVKRISIKVTKECWRNFRSRVCLGPITNRFDFGDDPQLQDPDSMTSYTDFVI